MDDLPYVWNEEQPWYLDSAFSLNPGFDIAGAAAGGPQGLFPTANFRDSPSLSCLPGNTPSQSSEYWGFFTSLVGVKNPIGGGGQPPNYTVLASFAWNTTYNNKSGLVRTLSLDPVGGGSGAIFNVADIDINDAPLEVRQLLLQTGAQGISTAPKIDKDAPMTAAFPSGPQGTNGWYTGPAQLALIATEIDGPSDIAGTSYNVDAGSLTAYTGPLTVSGDGIHAIQFFSVDQAGNVEAPRPSQTIKIDATPPVVMPPVAITLLATEAGGATGSASTILAAFLAGGMATDGVDPSPERLAPQVGGIDVTNSTLFPGRTTAVIFRFVDAAGNVGTATSNVTVMACATDVSGSVSVRRSGYTYNFATQRFYQTVTMTNSGASAITGSISLVLDSLSSNATLFNASGTTSCAAPLGNPYINLGAASLAPGSSVSVALQFTNPTKAATSYTTRVLVGSGAR